MKTYVIGKVNGKDVRCKCGGQVAVEASGWRQLPWGFGFHEDGKFHIDSVRFFGHFGFCMGKCQASNVFAPTGKKKLVSRMPKKINRALNQLNEVKS